MKKGSDAVKKPNDSHSCGRRISAAGLGCVMLLATFAGGCSSSRVTGFDFPVFGILKKSDKDAQETAGAQDLPPATQKLGTL
jgi:hypothetical protein